MKIVFSILILFMIIGCSSKEIKIQKIYTTPPNSMLKLYDIKRPMSKERFYKLDCKEKNRVLTLYTVDLISTVTKYKEQTLSLRRWKTKIKTLGTKE